MMDDREPTYWICDECAKKKNWFLPEPNGITAIRGLCGHCLSTKKEILIPTRDYTPRDGKKKYKGD